jgi:hypothetical protein
MPANLDIPGFPTISVGGLTFFDIASRVTPNRDDRRLTDGFAIHHSAGAQHFPTMQHEVDHIDMINQQHIDAGYGGFGYNAIGFESGRVYVVGDGLGRRAHVAYENGHLEGYCMAGNFAENEVPFGLRLDAGRWLLAKFRQRGLHPVRPHREWVNTLLHPEWASECCGDYGTGAIYSMLQVAAALNRG